MRIAPLLVTAGLVTCALAVGEAADQPGAKVPSAADLVDLRFGELFEPVGGRGLAYTAKARSLEGRRVRISGFMVRRDGAPAGSLLLTSIPVQLHDREYGLADDLPPSTVHAYRDGETSPLPFTPRRMALVGTLELGRREEPDGRISWVRLRLDPPPEP